MRINGIINSALSFSPLSREQSEKEKPFNFASFNTPAFTINFSKDDEKRIFEQLVYTRQALRAAPTNESPKPKPEKLESETVAMPEKESAGLTLGRPITIIEKAPTDSEEQMPDNGGQKDPEFTRQYRPPIIKTYPAEAIIDKYEKSESITFTPASKLDLIS